MGKKKSKEWETYEEVARQILDELAEELGLANVEGKQTVPGTRSTTDWESTRKESVTTETGFFS